MYIMFLQTKKKWIIFCWQDLLSSAIDKREREIGKMQREYMQRKL